MSDHEQSFGTIDISPMAVSTIVSQAVDQCYGVVGMSSKNLVNGIAQLLSRDVHKGIDVHISDDQQIRVDIYVIIEYGTRIKTVAEEIQSKVKFDLEKRLGRPVEAVNVFVQGLRVSKNKE